MGVLVGMMDVLIILGVIVVIVLPVVVIVLPIVLLGFFLGRRRENTVPSCFAQGILQSIRIL